MSLEAKLSQAIFFSAAAVSGSFGGLLAAAITNLNGRGGRPGWAVSSISLNTFTSATIL